jgi:hypothetical protein
VQVVGPHPAKNARNMINQWYNDGSNDMKLGTFLFRVGLKTEMIEIIYIYLYTWLNFETAEPYLDI